LRKIILKDDIGARFDADDPMSIAEKATCGNLASLAARYNWGIESRELLQAYASLP
jgi:hypothetical protein